MKQFEQGKTYYTRSICNHDCIFAYTVAKRTAKMATLVDVNGKEIRRKIYADDNGTEHINIANYSMAPTLSADREITADGDSLADKVDTMHRADIAAA